jgi:hypothetical protein
MSGLFLFNKPSKVGISALHEHLIIHVLSAMGHSKDVNTYKGTKNLKTLHTKQQSEFNTSVI